LFNNLIARDLDIYKEHINITKEQLEIGDIHIKFNDITFIYERKTVQDLLASIKDGRYKEQKMRMLSNSIYINYIIEGDDILSSKNNFNQNLLSSIYLYSIYRDNIKTLFTKTTDETSTLLLIIATKISENPDKFITNSNINNNEYIDCCKIKSKKNSNIDKETCYLLQLSQIPSISKEIAKNISFDFPTMRELIKALDTTDNKIELLMKIKLIGKTKALTILQYFGYVLDT